MARTSISRAALNAISLTRSRMAVAVRGGESVRSSGLMAMMMMSLAWPSSGSSAGLPRKPPSHIQPMLVSTAGNSCGTQALASSASAVTGGIGFCAPSPATGGEAKMARSVRSIWVAHTYSAGSRFGTASAARSGSTWSITRASAEAVRPSA
jgi:hypothetical protein